VQQWFEESHSWPAGQARQP